MSNRKKEIVWFYYVVSGYLYYVTKEIHMEIQSRPFKDDQDKALFIKNNGELMVNIEQVL